MTQAQKFLDEAYEQLDFLRGDLIASDLPASDSDWVQKGDWAALARRVGADRVFFVQNNPVVVFAKIDSDDPDGLRELFRSVWCMARPNLLFLASPGELAVYDLGQAPARDLQEWNRLKPLDTVREVARVADVLKAYHRSQIETGRLFEERRFGTTKRRADKSLILDLRNVRLKLMEAGLVKSDVDNKLKYAHALIGRSIFIRYLEDRGILKRAYFENLAREHRAWRDILASEPATPYVNSQMEASCYIKILENKEFTYALFRQLSHDLNGDMFPEDETEEEVVSQDHLTLLQRFLRSDTEEQQKLFFWAYRFDIIPIELVSSIYEEFYTRSTNGKDSKGTHYTPPALVEFILSQILTQHRLSEYPVVLDPACGSGIFLVEAFRRIIRHRIASQNGRRLSPQQLRKILRDQIRGIDLNEEAIRVAAFSLYLALLHYQEPKDILEQIERGYRLPCLVKRECNEKASISSECFDILQAENAFSPEVDMKADIVVGNPPWGDAPGNDADGRTQAKVALEWCNSRNLPVGDRERSQMFIWRSLSLLEPGGSVGLVVSSGVLHKHGEGSKAFRKEWLKRVSLDQIVHFAHVRRVFFPSANAPFMSVQFRSQKSDELHDTFMYASAKRTGAIDGTQSVILSKNDIHFLSQREMAVNDDLWKVYWWGNHHDKALLEFTQLNARLEEIADRDNTGQGFKRSPANLSSDWLIDYKELVLGSFSRYGALDTSYLEEVPPKVHRRGVISAYEGSRLLVGRGIRERERPRGQIVARFEKESFCFTNAINSIRLQCPEDWPYLCVLGILWSSFARYYFFMTGSSWGTWHNELHLGEILALPVRLPARDEKSRTAILNCVTRLRALSLTEFTDSDEVGCLESSLDQAVFDLYALSEPERDRIRDMCDVGLPFFYRPLDGRASNPIVLSQMEQRRGTAKCIHGNPQDRMDIRGYLEVFLQIWNRELEPDGEFSWHLVAPGNAPSMIAIVFSTQIKGAELWHDTCSGELSWKELLERLSENLQTPFHSDRIYIDGLVRAVSPTQITIIKRNEGRFWTRSAAREDAEATLLKAIHLDGTSGEMV